jgi:Fuc2NAc and GlcNAc transferase
MVLVISAGVLALYAADRIPGPLAAALGVGGLSVAAVGFWDDLRSAPIAVRMGVHFGAAVFAVLCLGAPETIRLGGFVVHLGPAGAMLSVLAIVWAINLFNFMDGIDGIAASEAAFILLAAAALGFFVRSESPALLAPIVISGAASLGFLVLNWAPARIFMGDVGSGYLGFVIAALALASERSGGLDEWIWIILGAVFLIDATLTLLRRLLRGERVYEAHRTHAYQWLARRWRSHARVTFAVTAVNLLWLLPCAWAAAQMPVAAPWICLAALTPLIVLALGSGSGRAE